VIVAERMWAGISSVHIRCLARLRAVLALEQTQSTWDAMLIRTYNELFRFVFPVVSILPLIARLSVEHGDMITLRGSFEDSAFVELGGMMFMDRLPGVIVAERMLEEGKCVFG